MAPYKDKPLVELLARFPLGLAVHAGCAEFCGAGGVPLLSGVTGGGAERSRGPPASGAARGRAEPGLWAPPCVCGAAPKAEPRSGAGAALLAPQVAMRGAGRAQRATGGGAGPQRPAQPSPAQPARLPPGAGRGGSRGREGKEGKRRGQRGGGRLSLIHI